MPKLNESQTYLREKGNQKLETIFALSSDELQIRLFLSQPPRSPLSVSAPAGREEEKSAK